MGPIAFATFGNRPISVVHHYIQISVCVRSKMMWESYANEEEK